MQVLVTGRNGQLARALHERMAVEFTDSNLIFANRPQMDLAKPSLIQGVLDQHTPDVIINAAAYTDVDKAEDEADLAHTINAVAPGRMARWAADHGARLIQISTDYVFDGEKDEAYEEADPVAPRGAYGASKAVGEEQVRDALPSHVILITAWVFSPFGRNFVKTMLQLSNDRDELRVVGDQYGNPTSALHLADGITAILKRWRTEPDCGLGATYHCAGTGTTSWAGFAERTMMASSRAGGPSASITGIASEEWPTKAERPKNSQLSCKRLQQVFGFEMPQWQTAVDETVVRLLRETDEAVA